MVKICQKCGTADPDDNAAFCHICGSILPRTVPGKAAGTCPHCGSRVSVPDAVFCDACGMSLPVTLPAPVPHPARRPGREQARCPSCGAAFLVDDPDYCDSCGVCLRSPDSPAGDPGQPVPDPLAPEPVQPRPAPQAPEREPPAPETRRGTGRRRLVIAGAVILVLLVAAGILSGMVPGFAPFSNATAAPGPQETGAPAATTVTTKTPAPTATPTKVKPEVTTVLPTTSPKTSPANATKNVSAAATTKPSGNVTGNTSAPAANTSSNRTQNGSATSPVPAFPGFQTLSVGQGALDGKGKLTLNSFVFKDKISDPVPSYAIGKKYLVVSVTYENLQQNGTLDASLAGVKVVDGGGFTFDQVVDSVLENSYLAANPIPARENRTGNLLFIVPPQATFLKLQYSSAGTDIASFQLT